ncbi:ARM REPEAT PROTEIN INTERACTING WITH ABF2-like [Gossypium australe]|uniref:ARM REPEAT PROTEIN INTERACTING WITH ABF2-like n=1 Tax=Gossypium australe TaxID=47621 RepID=A0A5B6WRM5_9ROSI|nr:ARM REPEAT PROTEIN INTERACTING WITH ABF2-like [Gossypium australe]
MRQEGAFEGALPVKHQDNGKNRRPKNKKIYAMSGESSAFGNKSKTRNRRSGVNKDYPPCQHCDKKGHPPFNCWRRPDANYNKCNQMGHEAII